MASYHEPVDVPRPKKRVTCGLVILAIFMPWLALYLDGASWTTIGINLAVWFFLFPVGSLASIIHAVICLCRTDKHRKYSKPARRRLRYENHYSASTQVRAQQKAVEAEPSPAPVERLATEPPPAPVMRAVEEESTPVERAPTEPPAAVKSSATSWSTSVSSSDVEKENPAAAAPPPRTATAPLPTTSTAPLSRAATAKKEDDPFKDPDA
ncbi:hypothetical protein SLS59_008947 [Nothophoma quercina]|uniref:Uncharacterized protein n=1 Tax=Nothophoma quercina TaxID=749835 RepID=A0ABR3QPN3_9PLEO